jgi:hypothetical protein
MANNKYLGAGKRTKAYKHHDRLMALLLELLSSQDIRLSRGVLPRPNRPHTFINTILITIFSH